MKNIKYILFVLVCLSFTSCLNTNEKRSNLYFLNLKGDVKSILEKKYEAVMKFGEISKGDIEENYSLYSDSGYAFLSNFKRDGNFKDIVNCSSSGNIESLRIMKYDRHKNCIESVKFNSEGYLGKKIISKYDKNNMCFETIYYRSDGSMNFKDHFIYDKNNNISKIFVYRSPGSLDCHYEYKFSDDDNLIETIKFSSDGVKELITTLKYNELNDCIESIEIWYHDYGDRKFIIRSTYKYDKHNNWIEKIEYTGENEKLKSIIEREIKYYN